jgi:energy-coupling factor transport system ATP-binding protein
MAERKPIISFRNFSFQYRAQKRPTLTDIDLEIYPGERVLIAGPSGSGKSTLAGCINGLNPFSNPGACTGTLTVDGVDAPHSSLFELSAHVGTVLQDPDGQFIGLTVGEDIAFALENSCTPQDEMHAITRHAAELVGIENHLGYAPHDLSGGQKQRVSLAGVMVDQVKILLFDEPLANLDPAAGKQAIELIDEIQKKTDTTVLIIEHRLEDVLWRNVDRIVLVNGGTILADLRPDELLSGSLLAENGIREPLYVTALRYAGVDITPDKHPAHVDSLVLDDTDTQKLRDWFTARPRPAAQPEREPLLEVKGLSFCYQKGQQTLQDVSFSIGKGEMVSIVGRNGAGKSTLSKLICGFETPDAGEIFLNGKPLVEENIRRRAQHIGYVMQNPNQMISKTMIYEEVALGLQRSGLTEEQIREKVEATLKVCGLYPFRNWPISALSFGQKKRVTIASVLVLDPELILLDEPTAGQDFRHYTDIMEFLRGLNARGVTVVMITHDMHLMLEYTRRALVFCDGRLIADRTAAAVLCDPALVKSTHSASGTPSVRAQPTALSSALWRPRSSHRYKILPARSSRQLCTAWVAR